MSLVKLAALVIVNNTSDPNNQSSKTFSGKNVAAAAVGGTTGFGLSDAIESARSFNKHNRLHRYVRRMGSIGGGFAGAAATYALLHKKKEEQKPTFYTL